MSFHPCIIIPIFNHGEPISKVISSIEKYNLHCFLVDDGSNKETKSVLNQISKSHPFVEILTLSQNQGKGKAISLGLKKAFEKGFSHALLMDADGQHDAEDVPEFLKASKENPHALLLGKPIFDESIPKSRLWGRQITKFWVVLETLSLKIGDVLCGFRLYPVNSSISLLQERKLDARMGFDLDMVVRLYRRGVPVHNIPTHVIYPKDGISQFRLLKDNLRISSVHARLFCEGIALSPFFLFRKIFRGKSSRPSQHWFSMAERGSLWGLRFMLMVYRFLGRRICVFFLYPVIAYFFLSGKKSRQASQEYLQNLYQYFAGKSENPFFQKKPKLRHSFHHFMVFGHSALDKIAAWSGSLKIDHLIWQNQEEFQRLVDEKKGAILLASHLGNIELIRALSEMEMGITINAIMYTRHAEYFNKMLNRANSSAKISIFPLESITSATIVSLKEKIKRGEYISMMLDRQSKGSPERMLSIPFLGKLANFPEGPLIMASLLHCPIYSIFCLREKGNQYRILFDLMSEKMEFSRKNRKEKIHEEMQRYVKRLEDLCKDYPYQWFNFFPFWQSEEKPPAYSVKKGAQSET